MMSCTIGMIIGAAGGLDLLRQRVEQLLAPRHADDTYAFRREHLGDGAADADAGAAHDGGPGLEIEVHV